MWRTLAAAIFTGDRSWAWRRRVTFAGCAVALAAVVKTTWFEPDHAWGAVVLTDSWAAFRDTLLTYAGLATIDDHLKRKADGVDKT